MKTINNIWSENKQAQTSALIFVLKKRRKFKVIKKAGKEIQEK